LPGEAEKPFLHEASTEALEPCVTKKRLAIFLIGCLCLAAQVTHAPSAAGSGSLSAWVSANGVDASGGVPLGSVEGISLPSPSLLEPGIVRIILLGTDLRPPAGGWRTDTMILVSIDPAARVVSMVSIPRDIYVDIPGHGKTRLNMADNFGEAEGYPGGGPALLRRMLEENLGLTFDRYVRIDFQGFVEAIDELGGIDVDVRCPTELWIPNMKADGEYLLWRSFSASMHHMDGEMALMYSRCRAHTAVFDRDRRQREVLLSLRNRVLELGLPRLLPTLFQLLDTMKLHVQTDLEPAEIITLAQLMMVNSSYRVNQSVIDLSVAPQWPTADGAWVMRPDRRLVKELLAGRMEPPSWEERTLAAEGVRIAVNNGTIIEGFASQIADRLTSRGYHVVEVGKAERLDYGETIIVSYVGASFALERLRQYLGVGEENVRYESDWMSDVAIRVVVGRDAQRQCP
jgi:LCP family protein required for cell wall assembly